MAFEPINTKHSIAKVSVVLTLSEKLKGNFRFNAEKIIEASNSLFYFTPMLRRRVQWNNKEISSDDWEDVGFVISDHEKNPTLGWRGVNDENRTALIYTSNNYDRWGAFLKMFKSVFMSTQEVLETNKIIAIGLEYIDEFSWKGQAVDFEWNKLFSKDSSILPQDFYENTHLHFNILRNRSLPATISVTEQLEIVRLDNIRARIRHHVSILPEEEIIMEKKNSQSAFFAQMENIHKYNKDVLQNLLTKKMSKRVGLQQNQL
jgi:uncharacterized protein (TIGR04255 family)